jgi:hypothetical protein
MRLPAAAAGLFTVSGLLTLIGVAYIVDCRYVAGKDVDSCWVTGQGMIAAAGGIGAAGAGSASMFQAGYRRGYWTLNTALRSDDRGDDSPPDPPER